MLQLHDIRAGYGRLAVLFDLSLTVGEGELVALLGQNGAGKSTLLKTAIGVVKPSRGSVVLGDVRVTHEPPHQRCARGIALSPEGRRVFANMTVRENLLSGASPVGQDVIERQLTKIFELFEVLGARLGQPAGSLSGGEQQMLAIGRALVSDPRVLLIDELSLGLAPLVVIQLYQALRRLADEGLGILVVDERATETLAVADRTYVLERGRIVFTGGHDEAHRRLEEGTLLGARLARS